MNRRGFVIGLSSLAFAVPAKTEDKFYGAIKPRNKLRRRSAQATTGISKNKQQFLWKYLEIILGNDLEPHDQGYASDCVAHATAICVDILAACDIFMRFEPERWKAKASVEMIYTGSRNEIGKGEFSGGGGSWAEWAVKFLHQYGVLHRIVYEIGNNRLDLSGYDRQRSTNWSDNGIPDWLEPEAKKHRIKSYTNIFDVRTAFDHLYVGRPIIMCSSYAFEDTRDRDGFSQPYQSEWHSGRLFRRGHYHRYRWEHAMALIGFKDDHRPGGLILNSHGNDNSGPKTHGQPDGSFWVDAEHIDTMLKDWDDCYSISAYVGHPRIPKLY